MGRPRIIIDWDFVNALCKIQCIGKEIAGALGISYDTLQRGCKREHKQTFAEYFRQKRKAGYPDLRRWQWEAAERGNVTMLIWLGKQYLGQKNIVESQDETKTPGIINIIMPKEASAEDK